MEVDCGWSAKIIAEAGVESQLSGTRRFARGVGERGDVWNSRERTRARRQLPSRQQEASNGVRECSPRLADERGVAGDRLRAHAAPGPAVTNGEDTAPFVRRRFRDGPLVQKRTLSGRRLLRRARPGPVFGAVDHAGDKRVASDVSAHRVEARAGCDHRVLEPPLIDRSGTSCAVHSLPANSMGQRDTEISCALRLHTARRPGASGSAWRNRQGSASGTSPAPRRRGQGRPGSLVAYGTASRGGRRGSTRGTPCRRDLAFVVLA